MAIQFMRGSGHSSSTVLADGQPYYDKTNSMLYIGDGSTAISALTPVAGKWVQTVLFATNYSNSDSGAFTATFNTATVYTTENSFTAVINTAGYFHYDHLYEAIPVRGIFEGYVLGCMCISAVTTSRILLYYAGKISGLSVSYSTGYLTYDYWSMMDVTLIAAHH